MFNVTVETSDDEFTLEVTDLRFVNKWGPANEEEVWLFTNDAPAPFVEQQKRFKSGVHMVYIAQRDDLERVVVK